VNGMGTKEGRILGRAPLVGLDPHSCAVVYLQPNRASTLRWDQVYASPRGRAGGTGQAHPSTGFSITGGVSGSRPFGYSRAVREFRRTPESNVSHRNGGIPSKKTVAVGRTGSRVLQRDQCHQTSRRATRCEMIAVKITDGSMTFVLATSRGRGMSTPGSSERTPGERMGRATSGGRVRRYRAGQG